MLNTFWSLSEEERERERGRERVRERVRLTWKLHTQIWRARAWLSLYTLCSNLNLSRLAGLRSLNHGVGASAPVAQDAEIAKFQRGVYSVILLMPINNTCILGSSKYFTILILISPVITSELYRSKVISLSFVSIFII
jgi:hypothetical protein